MHFNPSQICYACEAMGELTEKELRFIEHWLVEPNGTKAAIAAGYSESTAHAIAWENLRKPDIVRTIADRQLATRTKFQIRHEDIVRETARLAFSDIRTVASFSDERGVSFFSSDELSDDAAHAIAEVSSETTFRPGKRNDDDGMNVEKRRVKMYPKLEALKLLAQLTGALKPSGETNIGTQQNLVLPNGMAVADLVRLRDELKGMTNG
jgi:phage terminase small subunit